MNTWWILEKYIESIEIFIRNKFWLKIDVAFETLINSIGWGSDKNEYLADILCFLY